MVLKVDLTAENEIYSADNDVTTPLIQTEYHDSDHHSSSKDDTILALATAPTPSPKRKRQWYAHAILTIVNALYGGSHVIAKETLQVLHPMSLSLLRVSLATPCLFYLAHREQILEKKVIVENSKPISFLGLSSTRFVLFTTSLLSLVFAGLFNWLLFFGNR